MSNISIVNRVRHDDFKACIYIWIENPDMSLDDAVRYAIKEHGVEKVFDNDERDILRNHSILTDISYGFTEKASIMLDECAQAAVSLGISIDENWDETKSTVVKRIRKYEA